MLKEVKFAEVQLPVGEIASGEVLIMVSRPGFPVVVMNYSDYTEMKTLAETARRMKLVSDVDVVRRKAEEAGLTEEDVEAEVRAVRDARRN